VETVVTSPRKGSKKDDTVPAPAADGKNQNKKIMTFLMIIMIMMSRNRAEAGSIGRTRRRTGDKGVPVVLTNNYLSLKVVVV
jgi:hypothetical protein